jgi:hypothetical protein
MCWLVKVIHFFVVVCAEGSYTSNNRCLPCLLGQYQPARGQNKCLSCPRGQTTLLEGSRSVSDCIEGNVDECKTNVHTCGKNEECRDTPMFYECVCKEGYVPHNGTCTCKCRQSIRIYSVINHVSHHNGLDCLINRYFFIKSSIYKFSISLFFSLCSKPQPTSSTTR